jgi:cell division protein FtsZ
MYDFVAIKLKVMEDLINFDLQKHKSSIIKVVGVGGGGSNAVNHMYKQGIKDVDFIICNTDAQALANSPVPVKIQLGNATTEGRGAGNKPDVGRQAAIEDLQDIIDVLSQNTRMVFITAGMGGGTGTGAAPVIAKAAKEMGLLTVAIVTVPFKFEGQIRINQAVEGINEIRNYVDSLLVIHNEKLREMFGDLKISEAFSRADNVLTTAAKGIAEIITVHGYINVDFADVNTVMANSGVAIMGSGTAEGENRALEAIQQALASPLLNNNDIRGAKNILLNITSGEDEVSMDEVGIITDYVTSAVAKDTLLIWGTGNDLNLRKRISVTIIATGFETNSIPELYGRKRQIVNVPLHEEQQRRSTVTQNVFEVKTRDSAESARQRILDLDFATSSGSAFVDNSNEIEVKISKNRSYEKMPEPKRANPRQKDLASNMGDSNLIDDLENQPAYIRKKINFDEMKSPGSSDISKFTLCDDDERKVVLKPENPYLNNNVD